jgi:hypothetical protein
MTHALEFLVFHPLTILDVPADATQMGLAVFATCRCGVFGIERLS